MMMEKIQLTKKSADCYIVPLGKINLVFANTDVGMVGCGAFDVMALDKHGYPAARVKAKSGAISTVTDLMEAIVKDANEAASKLGVTVGMTGRQALEKM